MYSVHTVILTHPLLMTSWTSYIYLSTPLMTSMTSLKKKKKKFEKIFFSKKSFYPIKTSEHDFYRDFACSTPIQPHLTYRAAIFGGHLCKTFWLISQECLNGFPKSFFCLKAVNKLHKYGACSVHGHAWSVHNQWHVSQWKPTAGNLESKAFKMAVDELTTHLERVHTLL